MNCVADKVLHIDQKLSRSLTSATKVFMIGFWLTLWPKLSLFASYRRCGYHWISPNCEIYDLLVFLEDIYWFKDLVCDQYPSVLTTRLAFITTRSRIQFSTKVSWGSSCKLFPVVSFVMWGDVLMTSLLYLTTYLHSLDSEGILMVVISWNHSQHFHH